MTSHSCRRRASAVCLVAPVFFTVGVAHAACTLTSFDVEDCATVAVPPLADATPSLVDGWIRDEGGRTTYRPSAASILERVPFAGGVRPGAEAENGVKKIQTRSSANVDNGALLTFSVNPPAVGDAVKIVPPGIDKTATPALVVERESAAGNFNGSNATLMVGTSALIQTHPTWMNNIYSELEIKDVTAGGQGGYGEATRSRCDIDASVTHSTGCWGLSALSVGTNAKVPVGNIGVESEVDRGFADAPAPAGLSAAQFSVAYLASSGGGWVGPRVADAAFMVNPGSISGFQAGFICPRDGGGDPKQARVDVVHWACFYAGDKAPWAIDISEGTWTAGQIHGVNFDLDPKGDVWAVSVGLTGAPVPSYANQVSYGGATTTEVARCGSLPGAAGCVQINVAGKMRWMPYF